MNKMQEIYSENGIMLSAYVRKSRIEEFLKSPMMPECGG